jgi:Asp/Glu/hydantoin racemase
MTRVGLLHTVPALAEAFERDVVAAVPGAQVVHVVDSALLADAVRSGVDDALTDRVAARIQALAATGADAVLVTCSSIGDAAERAAVRIGVPVLRVDAPMARRAVAIAVADGAAGRIAVLATLAATLGPTGRLVERAAVDHRVVVTATVVDGAVAARDAGDPDRFVALVGAAVRAAAEDADVVVLAQASMAGAVPADVAVPVLTSPASGVAALAETLGRGSDRRDVGTIADSMTA